LAHASDPQALSQWPRRGPLQFGFKIARERRGSTVGESETLVIKSHFNTLIVTAAGGTTAGFTFLGASLTGPKVLPSLRPRACL